MDRRTVVIGMLGTTLDQRGRRQARWERWRPTVAVCQQEDLLVHRLDLIHPASHEKLLERIVEDIHLVSPETEVVPHVMPLQDPWDFEEVYGAMLDFAKAYPFDTDQWDYLLHITTGTHVAQICMFLLAESHYIPAKLLQTGPPRNRQGPSAGIYSIIDLDLSEYDAIARRFETDAQDDIARLKSGIETRNAGFNALIERVERVAARTTDPILLLGPTGAGKTQLARRIYDLKQARHAGLGPLVEVNCATLRGDAAMSALFGHEKGAFTGALQRRTGLLRTANGGVLLLDEVGELGLDEQSMLLRAIEEKRFLPLGSDHEVTTDFQLICGTNRNLRAAVAEGRFREDLLARIDLWTFHMPGLRERPEDIEPNLRYELDRHAGKTGDRVAFTGEAQRRFLAFATSAEALWSANFRDLSGAVTRMATLAPAGRITTETVEDECHRLRAAWRDAEGEETDERLVSVVGEDRAARMDRFDRVQLADVLSVCARHGTLSAAGRELFAESRKGKRSANDADRLAKYLARFGLSREAVCRQST